MTTANWLTITEIRSRMRTHPLRLSEVPLEHEISFPVPTLRWSVPAFAYFAGPCQRFADSLPQYGAPDRWWLVDAKSGRILSYALQQISPFAQFSSETIRVPVPGIAIKEQQAAVKHLEVEITNATSEFFATERLQKPPQSLVVAFDAVVPQELQPFYRALAPDFFTWMESSQAATG